MASDCLVSLSPVETLVFQLEKDTAPKVTLRVTNTSNTKVAFKVKTTQPTWYYVRPNQQVVNVGATEEVVIVLVDAECSRFLENASSDTADRLDKHRFLVQSKTISDQDYDTIMSIAPTQRTEEYGRIWNTGPKEEKRNLRLKVEFQYPDAAANKVDNTLRSVSENLEKIRNHIAVASSVVAPKAADSDMTPESMFAELKSLRNKYDTVVEYTVRLTAERDLMVQRLESTEKELLVSRKKSNQSDAQGSSQKSERIVEKKNILKGFSLIVVLLAALLSFLFGRYYKS